MYKIVFSSYAPTTGKYYVEIVCDSKEDVQNIPTDFAPSSLVAVADKDCPMYMLNASNEWKEL